MYFHHDLDEESLNSNHQIVIVAASLDDSTERIVKYLSEKDIPINVLFFQVFTLGSEQLLSRAWLLDPVHTQVSAATAPSGPAEPWNGEFYASFGESATRSWLTLCNMDSFALAEGRGTQRLFSYLSQATGFG